MPSISDYTNQCQDECKAFWFIAIGNEFIYFGPSIDDTSVEAQTVAVYFLSIGGSTVLNASKLLSDRGKTCVKLSEL